MIFKDLLIKSIYNFTWFSKVYYEFTMNSSVILDEACKIPKFNSINEIKDLISRGGYKYDNIGGVIKDYLIHPTVIQCRLNKQIPIGDCDDHAIYWCAAIKKSDLAKKVWFSFYSMKQKKENPEYSAHAVCVFQGKDDNFYWCDYSSPKKIDKVENFLNDSAALYGREPISGATWEVVALQNNDTPIFGQINKVIPKKKQ